MHATISLDAAWLTTVLLLSLRLTAVFLMTPLLSAASIPVVVRVLLVLGLASALSLGLPGAAAVARGPGGPLPGASSLVEAGLTELALGATLALGVLFAFSAFTMAGQLLGIQMGFGLAQVVDPSTKLTVSITTAAFDQLGVLVFFLADGHHALMRGVAYSLERFPLGRPWPLGAAVGPVLTQVGGLFSLGFALAAPVVFCLLMTEFALGAVARNMPQINMLTLGVPVKVVVGLVALALWFAGMGDAMDRVYASIFRCWDTIFPVAAAGEQSGGGLQALRSLASERARGGA